MFFEIFSELCKSKGITVSAVLTELNMNRSTATFWKQNKSNPSQETILKIANYFGVSVDYLMGRKKEETATNIGDGLEERLQIFNSLSPEAQDKALDYMRYLASQEASGK